MRTPTLLNTPDLIAYLSTFLPPSELVKLRLIKLFHRYLQTPITDEKGKLYDIKGEHPLFLSILKIALLLKKDPDKTAFHVSLHNNQSPYLFEFLAPTKTRADKTLTLSQWLSNPPMLRVRTEGGDSVQIDRFIEQFKEQFNVNLHNIHSTREITVAIETVVNKFNAQVDIKNKEIQEGRPAVFANLFLHTIPIELLILTFCPALFALSVYGAIILSQEGSFFCGVSAVLAFFLSIALCRLRSSTARENIENALSGIFLHKKLTDKHKTDLIHNALLLQLLGHGLKEELVMRTNEGYLAPGTIETRVVEIEEEVPPATSSRSCRFASLLQVFSSVCSRKPKNGGHGLRESFLSPRTGGAI